MDNEEVRQAVTKSLTIGKVFQDTYAVTDRIGEGGMGVVYEVSHLRLERKFAIKVLVKEAASHPEALARFQREARVTSGLGHPHIVEIVDFNVGPDGRPYIVMERLDGEALAARLKRTGRLDLSTAASITRQTTSALQAAHDKGIIHRDLKPENIFLCKRGIRDDYVKLLDFGISKVLDSKSALTRNESLIGSPAYMAPELVRKGSAKTEARADVYSMGVVLFEMLSGTVPFKAKTIYNLLYKIVNEDPPSLGALYPDVPPSVERVVARALRKNPDQRHGSMEELWKDLASALNDLDVESTELIKVHHTAWPEDGEMTPPPRPLESVATAEPQDAAGIRDNAVTTQVRRPPPGGVGKLALIALVLVLGLGLVAAVSFHLATNSGARLSRTKGPPGGPDAELRASPANLDAASPAPVDLAPAPDSTTPESPLTADTALPSSDLQSSRPKAPTPPTRLVPARLNVGTLPAAADIYLDGKKVGQSPLVLRQIKPGRHLLEVRKGGQRKRVVINLRPGQQKTVSVVLK